MCHYPEYKLLELQARLSEENKRNATTQQYITAKISGCALKPWSPIPGPRTGTGPWVSWCRSAQETVN